MRHYMGITALTLFWGRIKDYIKAVVATKADKTSTLAGYGITDAYTKKNVDEMLAQIELTPGPAGEQGAKGEKGDKGDKGDVGPAGINGNNGFGLKGEIDVVVTTNQNKEKNTTYVESISNIDNIIESGFYVLHPNTGSADHLLSVEVFNENYIIQYVLVGGYIGVNTQKFIYRVWTEGAWSVWQRYDICTDKQDILHSGEAFTITVGETLLYMNEDKVKKLKELLES